MPVNKPTKVEFGEQEMIDLKKFVRDNLKSLMDSYQTLHTSTIDEWDRIYKGLPEQTERDWPWPGASNVVIQLVAENVDTLKARIIGTIYEILPLWTTSLVGKWPEEEQGAQQRAVYEEFMNLMGLEPGELDLYRVESHAANDMIKYGSVLIKSPWETDVEKIVTGTESIKGIPAAKEYIRYDGPRPEKVNFRDWGATPSAPTWEKADFKYHHYVLRKQDILKKVYEGTFDKEAADKILDKPDRTGASNERQKQEQAQNIQADHTVPEWDFYECWFWYWHNNAKWRIVYTYHISTDTCMIAIFNFYPDNEEPFDFGRLGYTDDALLGYGFAEMLKFYQEEVTTGHNQRNDNRTLGNTSVALVGRNNKIDANIGIFPMSVLPINPDEFDLKQLGVPYPTSVEEERLTLELARSRAGVDQAIGGMGGGVTNPKKGGNYSAMGTFSVMQAGNRRVNVNIADFRYMHLRIGRRCGRMYANFGIGDRVKRFGLDKEILSKALINIREGRMELPIKAATASINKELEKQNDMLLTQVLQRHFAAISQILAGLGAPGMPDVMKKYLIGVIGAQGQLMSRLLRNFGYDDISRLQPEMEAFNELKGAKPDGENVTASQGGESNANPNVAFPVQQQPGIRPTPSLPQTQGGSQAVV